MHGLLPLEEAVVVIMILEATMVLVEQVEQPLEAQVVLLTAKVVVMLLAVLNLLVAPLDLAVHRLIMVLLDQLSKEATEDPVAVVVHLVALAAVDTTAAVAAVVIPIKMITVEVEVEVPLISAHQIFPLLHILPQGQEFVIQIVQ
jgi:hypothetical protein|tara:strand:+ start:114 stop:548 length:435 start_codon:yes stop_codon:yes gene_type:complete